MPIVVTKSDGTVQLFQKDKIVETCLRMGANREIAQTVADSIEEGIYDGINTDKILGMIFKRLRRYMPSVRHHEDLRRALAIMESKPDFELFIQCLLREHGYEVTSNAIVRGRCVEHEIDAIARRDGKTYLVEVKHHSDHHTLTGLDVSRIARAIFEDVTEGYKLGLNSIDANQAIVFCNTKLSEHAKRYADCRGIEHIGWKHPLGRGLENMIEGKKLYPVTYMRNLDISVRQRLVNEGIILLKQLAASDPLSLSRRTKLPASRIEPIVKKAKIILSSTP